MQTIILLDRLGKELQPLTDNTSVALLPLAAKPLIEYTLEMLATAKIGQATLVTGPFANLISDHVGNGQRWGLQLDCRIGGGEEDLEALLGQLPQKAFTELLVLRGDILLPPVLPAFLNAAASRRSPELYAVTEGRLTGIALFRQPSQALARLSWNRLVTDPAPSLPDAQTIALDGFGSRLIAALKDYQQANLDAVAGRLPGLNLPGREIALGLRQGLDTVLSPRSLEVGVALVGSQCRIHPTVRFTNEVAVSDQVIIDRGARLCNAVILPHTYIGELVTVRDAIVWGNDLIDIETGTAIKVVDAFLLADLREAPLSDALSDWLNRAAGLALLFLSLPLWPLAPLAAWMENPGRLVRTRRLRGNRVERDELGQSRRREFTAMEWATRITPLAKLPLIWPVITGDLQLVGVEAVTRESAARRVAQWELLADDSPAGLLGPTQLLIPADAPSEERLMSDAFFAAQQNAGRIAALLWQACLSLFHIRTWWPTRSVHR